MLALKIYLAGLSILIGAIALNWLASALGLATWYEFLKSAGQSGPAAAIRDLNPLDLLFLVVFYPAALGLCAYVVLRLAQAIVR